MPGKHHRNIPKRHHVIPRYYLSGFTTSPESQSIWVYPTNGDDPFRTNISNTGVIKHYYSKTKEDGRSTEEFLAEDVEGPANSVLKKLRSRTRINSEEKYKLSIYLMGMMTRVPTNRDRVNESISEKVEDLREDTLQRILVKLKSENSDSAYLSKLLDDIPAALSRVERKLIEELKMPYFDEFTISVIHMMNWGVFLRREERGFVTSDNPFCFTEHTGLLDQEGYFIFPLSSNLLLTGAWADDAVKDFALNGQVLDWDGQEEMNTLIVRSAKNMSTIIEE